MRGALAAAVLIGAFSLSSLPAAVITDCTEAGLRSAIQQGGIVTFACDGVITLSNTIPITADVTLDGQGRDVTISGGRKVRLFDSPTGAHIRLNHLVLADGQVKGTNGDLGQVGQSVHAGGFQLIGGTLEATDCRFVGHFVAGGTGGNGSPDPSSGIFPANGGDAQGGVIQAQGASLWLTNCVFQTNSAARGAPGFRATGVGQPIFAAPGVSAGGAISMNSGELVLDGCSFLQDAADNGGALRLVGVHLFAVRSRFERCSAGAGGGAAWVRSEKAEFTNCLFALNTANGTARSAGGALNFELTELIVADSTFSANMAQGADAYFTPRSAVPGGDGEGGALWINSGSARILRCALIGNTAGGGRAEAGVGAFAGRAAGGAIWSGGSSLLNVENSTLVGNQSGVGAFFSFTDLRAAARGGAVAGLGGTMTFNGCTIASNACLCSTGTSGGGGCLANNTFVLLNSIVAWNTTNGAQNNVLGEATGDHNVSSDATPPFPVLSTKRNVDPRFGSLGDHDGPTLTLALLPDSPAIDAANDNSCPRTDQRGVSRPALQGCDAGAFEFVPTEFHLESIQFISSSIVRIGGTGIPNADFGLEESGDFEAWHSAGTGTVDRFGYFMLSAPRNPERSFYRTTGP